MAKKYADRQDLLDWIELLDGNMWREPTWTSSKIRITAPLNDSLEVTFDLTAILSAPFRHSYGREDGYYPPVDGWNSVKKATQDRPSFHLKGKGSRDSKNWAICQEYLDLLFS